jgi:Ca-activated chloride channel family protein
MRDDSLWAARIPLEASSPAEGISPVWAREKIASLMDALREGTPETEVRARVIELATAHRLITKYTSFVAVDKTPAREAGDSLKLAAVPTLLPEGWEYNKVFGEMPQGATDSRFAFLSGALLFLLGFALLRRRAA